MRGGGNRHVPQGLDRPLLLDLVDRLDRLHHALTEPLCEERVQIVLDTLLASRLDRLYDRLGRPLVVLLEDGGDLFQPTIGGAVCVADADLSILVGTPHDAVRTDIVEQEEPEAERLVAGLGVPDEDPRAIEPEPLRRSGTSMRRSSSARNTNMSRSLAKSVVFSLVTVMRLPNSPGTRQCPETPSPKRSTSASTISASQIRP